MQDVFWGDRHGQFEDPFEHRWTTASSRSDVLHHDIVAAAAKAFG